MNKVLVTPWIIVALLIIALFVVYTKPNKSVDFDELVKANEELRATVDRYQTYADSINKVVILYEDSITVLSKNKTKIVIKYEKDLSNVWNPAIVSNDSICSFIAAKIRH